MDRIEAHSQSASPSEAGLFARTRKIALYTQGSHSEEKGHLEIADGLRSSHPEGSASAEDGTEKPSPCGF